MYLLHVGNCFREAAKLFETLYNISTYSSLWPLADQLEVIWPQTLQDLYISIGTLDFLPFV